MKSLNTHQSEFLMVISVESASDTELGSKTRLSFLSDGLGEGDGAW